MKIRTHIRRSQAAWLSLIQQQIKSHLSAAEFCRQHHLNEQYFSKRKRELHGKSNVAVSGNRFIQVQSAQPSNAVSTATMVLHYRDTQLHIPAGSDLRALAQLMTGLS